MFSRIISYLP
jgi:hypothetical protein